MEKFLENLQEAENIIQTIDHMVYVTFPLIQDKKLLLKIILETKTAIANCINSILQYEYLYKRIRLYKEPKAPIAPGFTLQTLIISFSLGILTFFTFKILANFLRSKFIFAGTETI